MDPLGATASCIAIVQILGTARSLLRTSQHALNDIDRIMSELDSLRLILEDLEAQEYKSVRLVQTMIRCEGDLNALRERLEAINRRSDRKKRWKWIFIKEDINGTLNSIRGMRENLLLAMTTSYSALLRDVHQQMVLSITSHQQHPLESSTDQRQLYSVIDNKIVPHVSSPHGHSATSHSLQSGCPRCLPLLTARWTQKWLFQFALFDIIIRTNGLRQRSGLTKNEKRFRQASNVLLRFKPSPLLTWLVNTAVFVEMTWGDTVGGLKINPRFYVQVPDSHQLIKAARTGNISLVRELINTSSATALCMTDAGWTPLHFAAAKGHLDMCEFLIFHGADLNAVGYIGMTPLHAAATFGQIEVVKLLITKGSDPNIFHDHGLHAVFQLFTTTSTLQAAEKLAAVEWIIRKQEHFIFDVHAVDVLHRDLTQVIIQSEIGTSITGRTQQSRLVDALLSKGLRLDNQNFEGSTALHEATKCGRLDIVEQLLNGSAMPTIEDNRGRKPIHYAANLGNIEIVRLLLGEGGAGINDKDVVGWTPLRLAATGGHLDTAKYLIDLGAHHDHMLFKDAMRTDDEALFDYFLSIGIKPNAGVLLDIIFKRNLRFLHKCILAGVSPNGVLGFWTPSTPSTPLTMAVRQGRAAAVQLLLSMGADVDLPNTNGDSALLLAVREGELEIVDILLRAGAATHDLSFKESPTVNLIDVATKLGYEDVVELLCKAGAPKPAADQLCAKSSFGVEEAAIQNRVDTLKEMAHQGYYSNACRYGRWTPFGMACPASSEAAMLMIHADADLTLQTKFLQPLFYAAKSRLPNLVQFILDKGADINQLNSLGQTAILHMLDVSWNSYNNLFNQVKYEQTERIVKILIRGKINLNAVDQTGHTALGMACWHGLTSVVQMLLEAHANISAPSRANHRRSNDADPDNDTWSDGRIPHLPLELAARAGHEDIVQLLLSKGANWRSLKQGKAIATSHAVLVRRWFDDEGCESEDGEAIFLGCESPDAQVKVSCAQDVQESDNEDNRQKIASNTQNQPHKTKRLRRHLIDSALIILDWLESRILHLCVGVLAIVLVSLLLFHHKVPFTVLQSNWPILRVLLWGLVLAWIWKVYKQ